jgi:hypothetical protein
MVTLRASATSCVMSASTANSSAVLEARVILETWRTEYNESRPHSSLGYQTPGEFARRSNSGLRSPSGLPTPRVAINTKTNHKQQTAEFQI